MNPSINPTGSGRSVLDASAVPQTLDALVELLLGEVDFLLGAIGVEQAVAHGDRDLVDVPDLRQHVIRHSAQLDEAALRTASYRAIGGDFLGDMASPHGADLLPVTRSLIRHDADAVARALIELYDLHD